MLKIEDEDILLELVIAPGIIQPKTLEEVEEQFLFLDGGGEVLHPGIVLNHRDCDGSKLPAPGRACPGGPHSRNIPESPGWVPGPVDKDINTFSQAKPTGCDASLHI